MTEQLPSVLFDQRLLIGAGHRGLRRIGFGFGLLRNYIIAFHVRRWQEMASEKLAQELGAIADRGVRAEAMTFFYPFAAPAQKLALDGLVRENALNYLREYGETDR